jgi:hypothetical protein
MKFTKGPDIVLNIILPLFLGSLVYLAGKPAFIPALIRNYLPDSLWAYAFISSILIIWDRAINRSWIAIVFLAACCFEGLQGLHVIAGTGDIVDIFVYFLSFTIALLLNSYFKTIIFTQSLNREK